MNILSESVQHWKDRAEKAEAEVKGLIAERDALGMAVEKIRMVLIHSAVLNLHPGAEVRRLCDAALAAGSEVRKA